MSLSPTVPDRRTQLEVRLIFPSACETLKPYFDPSNSWGGGANANHEHLALRALKEEFPQLSTHESFIVIATVKRLYASGWYTPVP
ncbi:MAG: hypothetical protein K9K38_15355 [Rhodoferax sp.]|nr:hypothetical protein [Rhodoferax sp.]